MSETPAEPYSTLGNHLRYLREQQRESVAEVSGAVEIDETVLERIEAGCERPPEEVLMLLISHFNMQDQEAVQLWELAGYDGEHNRGPTRTEDVLQEAMGQNKSVIVVLGLEGRTMYTDNVIVQADTSGVKLNFGQLTSKQQHQPLAKLGMSYEQAAIVLQELQLAVLKGRYTSGPKLLPPPKNQ